MPQDILIRQSDSGNFDLVIDGQDFEAVGGLETSVAVLLFTDARAAPEQVGNVEKRRGWAGNLLRSVELGGMLWLSEQVRNEQEIRNKIEDWAESSLQPLMDDGIVSDVSINADYENMNSIILDTQLNISGDVKNIELLLTTNLGNLVNGG